MKKSIKYQRRIIGVEKRLGFLYVPVQGQEFMPTISGKVSVLFEGNDKPTELSYNSDYKRIFGLTSWYNKNKVDTGTLINVELTNKQILLTIASNEIPLIEDDDEVEGIDLSGLSTGAKGNIVEDRIKELILLYGQGLLNVYKPVVDNRGIDLVVMKNGFFYPIFIQVKSRFNAVKKGRILIDVGENTFSIHNSFYIVGAIFNPSTLELEDKVLLIPSKDYDLNSNKVVVKGKNKKRFTVSIKENTKSYGAKYFIRKNELVEKLMEKFEEMAKYYP